jgi:hypothetical protein
MHDQADKVANTGPDADVKAPDAGNEQAVQLVAQTNGDVKALRELVKTVPHGMREPVIAEIQRLFGNAVCQKVLQHDANNDVEKTPAAPAPVPIPYPNVAGPVAQAGPEQQPAPTTQGDEPGTAGGGVIAEIGDKRDGFVT